MSASKQKGTAAETAVVRFLQHWWPDAERRALSGNKDKGDVAGVPGVAVEIKAAARLALAKWQRETLDEQENAGALRCVLVVKRPYKPVAQWDAYLPAWQVGIETEASEWVRMDLLVAVLFLTCPSPPYLLTTVSP
ncbi:hypothetical protein OG381_34305 [Streptomyces sp. NBC_00490]|uniref:hypothetical protein n=1 Tax=Streptomyces sp. NBC_00490 TaxID=2903657 RepID=UPI002E19805A